MLQSILPGLLRLPRNIVHKVNVYIPESLHPCILETLEKILIDMYTAQGLKLPVIG